MKTSYAVAAACVVVTFGTGLAADVFDSPGRSYREQIDGIKPLLFPADAAKARRAADTTLMKIQQVAEPFRTPESLEEVAEFAGTETGAKEKISRALMEAGIPFLLADERQTAVQVPPAWGGQARAVLRKLRDEASGAVGTLHIPAEQVLPQDEK